MASLDEAQQAILDLIAEVAATKSETTRPLDVASTHKGQGETILKLAEARAWLKDPAQPHG
jgi:hypothetical protein